MFNHVCYVCFVCILAWTSSLYLQLEKYDIREQVFITVKSTILVFKVLLQVSWKFNFSIETISNTLELNYRAALIELEHGMQSHMSCIFVYILQIHAKCFRILTLYVNNLEPDNNLSQKEIRQVHIRIWSFFFVLTHSAKYFPVWDKTAKLFSYKICTRCRT